MSKTTTEMQLVAVSKLIPYVNNARTHSAEQIMKLRSSLREFGFINPVIIDREYNVIAGHGRILEMIRLEELEQARKELDKTSGIKPMKQNMFKAI